MEMVRDCFAPDCDVSRWGPELADRDAMIEFIRGVGHFHTTMHMMGNQFVEVEGDTGTRRLVRDAHAPSGGRHGRGGQARREPEPLRRARRTARRPVGRSHVAAASRRGRRSGVTALTTDDPTVQLAARPGRDPRPAHALRPGRRRARLRTRSVAASRPGSTPLTATGSSTTSTCSVRSSRGSSTSTPRPTSSARSFARSTWSATRPGAHDVLVDHAPTARGRSRRGVGLRRTLRRPFLARRRPLADRRPRSDRAPRPPGGTRHPTPDHGCAGRRRWSTAPWSTTWSCVRRSPPTMPLVARPTTSSTTSSSMSTVTAARAETYLYFVERSRRRPAVAVERRAATLGRRAGARARMGGSWRSRDEVTNRVADELVLK